MWAIAVQHDSKDYQDLTELPDRQEDSIRYAMMNDGWFPETVDALVKNGYTRQGLWTLELVEYS